MKPVYWCALLLLCGCCARADTVTTTDHLSVNGTITKMENGVITLDARFASGSRTVPVQISAVRSIEFNSTTYNPGAPPKTLGIGPSRGAAPAADEGATDVVVLRGGERKDCKLAGIDPESVRCAGKGGTYGRRVVLRILVGAK